MFEGTEKTSTDFITNMSELVAGGNKYPSSVFCIIATEFCERFSFCGLRTILSLYLRNELLFSENTATVVYHIFIMMCYVVPIAGAICADSFLGRYRTILCFSLIYLIGNILMCVAAVPQPRISPVYGFLTAIGLGLIATGTGGIKPCVAAFGGDQFYLPYQKELLQQFFSIFYFSINLGGFVGMILTPILRKGVTCFGDDTCYALGFGFPAALMLLALLLFVSGKPFYRLKTPKENIILRFICCALYALIRRCKTRNRKKNHWLDHARNKYHTKLIYDMKIVFSVLLLYTPLPIFWSLFDQQGSRWTFQASRMDGSLFGLEIVPDQMQVINPAIVLILIPIFDRFLYPRFAKIGVLKCPLHRMAIGGLIAGFAFLSAGILELVLETTYPELPDKQKASFNFINTLPCNILIRDDNQSPLKTLKPSEMWRLKDVPTLNETIYNMTIWASSFCGDRNLRRDELDLHIIAIETQIETILISLNEENEITSHVTDPVDFKKSLNGGPRIRIAYLRGTRSRKNVTVSLVNWGGFKDIYFISNNPSDNTAVSAYMELPPGTYEYKVRNKEGNLHKDAIHLALGGVYTLVLREGSMGIEFAKLYTMSPPNTVNMLWLIPQYFLISVAEIMFGIAGLEFSFTQAPKCLKTVTIAAWYLSVAIGNLLVIIITQSRFFNSQAHEFFLFAMLIVADMVIFTQMAVNYEIVQMEADSSVCFMNKDEETSLLEDKTSILEAMSASLE